MKKKIIIIGAGVAGLTAGCHLQRNGYDTRIFELHTLPGGLCTSWKRKRYTIDGCIHWLMGAQPNNSIYGMWNEIIDMEKLQIHEYDEYMRVEGADGSQIIVYADVDKLEREFLDKAPEDADVIREFANVVRKFTAFDPPNDIPPELFRLTDIVKMLVKSLPYMGDLKKYVKISAKDFAARCRNPLLRKTFELMFLPEMSVLFQMITMAWFNRRSAGYPIGGSLHFSRLIEKKYLELGGEMRYRSKVARIVTEGAAPHARATGIVLENGAEHRADIVISAADGHYTIFDMLGGKFIDKTIQSYYDDYLTFPSYLQVSLGVADAFENEPSMVCMLLEKPLVIDDRTNIDNIGYRIMNFDPTLAPKGKSVIMILIPTDNYRYWVDLKENNLKKYTAEKDRIARDIIRVLGKRFKNIRSKIEVVDVSTPSTVIRYTNNWKGSFEGWVMDPRMGFTQMKKELPGLTNFYMIGQWVSPGGGLPSALYTGRHVAQIICARDGRRFVAK